jgi:uncharacterized LabA/DUF88 family protein
MQLGARPVLYRVIAYIDGFNLYYGMREKGWQRYYWLNIQALVQGLLREDQKLAVVKYFTALVSSTPSDPDKCRRQNAYLEAIGTLQGVQILYGHYLEKSVKCFECGGRWVDHEEKKTDVNIAVEMLTDAYEDRFDTALLISGDSDLADLVRTIRSRSPQKWVVIAFPPDRHSSDLLKVASRAFTIGRKKLADSQFPDAVAKADGYVLQRPKEWK